MRLKKAIVISAGIVVCVLLIGGTIFTAFKIRQKKEADKASEETEETLTPEEGSPDTRAWNDKIEDFWLPKGSLLKNYSEQRQVSTNELTPYSYENFCFEYGMRDILMPEVSLQCLSLYSFNQVFPVQMVKKISEEKLFVVYRLESKDGATGLAYVFFERETHYLDEQKDPSIKKAGEYESWMKTGEIYFVSHELSSSDFSEVKKGDSFSRTLEIDPAIALEVHIAGERFLDNGKVVMTSPRVLSDGIMLIEFERDQNSKGFNEYKVIKKTFYPYPIVAAQSNFSLTTPNVLEFD